MSLIEFWVRLHKAIDILADHYGLSDQLGSYVKNLRLCYLGKVTGGYPDFSEAGIKDAYLLAYHPGHAYSYLNIFLNHEIGDKIIQNLDLSSSVGVLGAGAGAETLAFFYLLADRNVVGNNLSISLVDMEDWSSQREVSLIQALKLLDKTFFPKKIKSFSYDLVSSEGTLFLKKFIPAHDLIICPAIFTELPADSRNRTFINIIFENMSRGAKILIVDQSKVKRFDDACIQWARDNRMECLHMGNSYPLRVPDPPAQSFADHILNGSNGLMPRKNYVFSSILLRKI